MLDVNRETCLDCAGCICLCPESALTMNLDGLQIDRDACTLCAVCVRFCPVEALTIIDRKAPMEV